MTKNPFETYIVEGGHHRVEGWIEEGALSMLTAINAYQRNRGIEGSVAEIGVHHGRSFIALAAMRQSHEFAVAVDIFEHQELNPDHSGRGNSAAFAKNLESFGVADRVAVLTRDSLTLRPGEIAAAAHGRPVRMFSVDGSHTAEHTLNDLKLAEEALAPAGVVVLDDWCNPDWPGVQEGLFAFIDSGTTLLPFAYGNYKLLLAPRAVYQEYFGCVAEWIKPRAEHYREVMLCGTTCHYLLLPSPKELVPIAAACGAAVLDVRNPSGPAGMLGQGWGDSEPWGRWTVGPEAEFTILPPPGSGLRLELMGFVASLPAGTGPAQVVTLIGAGGPLGEWVIDNEELAWYRAPIEPPPPSSPGSPPGPVTIRLSLSATRSPKSLGLSDDARELGIRAGRFVLGWSQLAQTQPAGRLDL